MFQPFYLLPQSNPEEQSKYQQRWNTAEGEILKEKILGKIRAGAGEDFLQWDFENKQLGFLEDYHDLKGFNLFEVDIDFPKGDNFEYVNFSYAELYHSKFKNATFPGTIFEFAKIYNCEFINCLFGFSSFYACNIEKCKFINCDFIEHNSFINTNLSEVQFKNCFFMNGSLVTVNLTAKHILISPYLNRIRNLKFNWQMLILQKYIMVSEMAMRQATLEKDKESIISYKEKMRHVITRHLYQKKYRDCLLNILPDTGLNP